MQDRDGWNFSEWCKRRGFSRATGYNLKKTGLAPKIIKVGSLCIVTREADEEWLRRMEARQNAVAAA